MFQEYPDVMSVQQTAKALGIGKNQAYALINSNTIKHLKIGRNIKVPKLFLLDYVRENEYNGLNNGGFNLLSGKEIIAL
jgi:excisionase family DNA binding protein